METWETLTMSQKEAPRAGLVKAALAGQISNAQGARALRISVRQFRRLKARYQQAGVRGLRHGLRGRASPRALEVEVRDRVLELIQTTYRELNDSHCTEKLREVEGLPLSRSTLRRLRRGLGLPPKRRSRGRRHPQRQPPPRPVHRGAATIPPGKVAADGWFTCWSDLGLDEEDPRRRPAHRGGFESRRRSRSAIVS